jgi:hypothetical protein
MEGFEKIENFTFYRQKYNIDMIDMCLFGLQH